MTPEEKKALDKIKNELHNYPEMMMITVSRKDLELVVKRIEKATDRRQAKSVTNKNILYREYSTN